MKIVTTDVHLTDSPSDEYRWEVFQYILRENVDHVYILGDLAHKKDRHSSILVNRLTDQLREFTRRQIPVTILRGNHDTPLNGPPYWNFLNDIPGISFISQPTAYGRLLLLPHSTDPVKDWSQIDMSLYNCIMCHYTRSGVDVGGHILHVEDKIEFPPDIPIYSGDIHVPQTVGGITYIGSPHPIIHGDHHPYRMLLLNDDYSVADEIQLRPLQKHILEVNSLEELHSLYIQPGDQAKIKFTISASQISQWPVEQEAITQWARSNNVLLTSVEAKPILYQDEQTGERLPASSFTPTDVFVQFTEEEGVEENLFYTGATILSELIETQDSPTTRHGIKVSLDFAIIEDFKSFVGTHEIYISSDVAGLHYVGGKNLVNPRRGSNGSGKSAFWDAIVWCWTGFSVRGGRASDLVSWGKKTPKVVTAVSVDGVVHIIERSGNPNKLFLDSTPVDQKVVDDLLLPRQSLLQSVIFGQSTKLFYDLSISERGALLDEVMNLDIWLAASDQTAKRAVDTKHAVDTHATSLAYQQGQLDTLVIQEQAVTTLSNAWVEGAQIDTNNAINDLASLEDTYNIDMDQLAHLETLYADAPDLQLERNNIQVAEDTLNRIRWERGQCQHALGATEQSQAFYKTHSVCPTCQQRIPPDFASTKMEQIDATYYALAEETTKLTTSEEEAATKLVDIRNHWEETREYRAALETEIAVIRNTIEQDKQAISSASAIVKELAENTRNPYTEQIQDLRASIASQHDRIQEDTRILNTLKAELLELDYWKQGFKKIRLFQVEQVLNRLYLETANAANALGIGEWKIQYSTEVETKSGTMRPGIHITVTTDGFGVVEDSGGESQRIRLAVTMGISSLIQNMAGITFDFEVIDEPTTWLSPEGIDDLLEYLRDRATNLNKSIFLLDQRTLDNGMFDQIWTVVKSSEGSKMELIKGV